MSSVKEYVDHRLLKDLRAFTNKTVSLYNYNDEVYFNKSVYGSPYATWAYNTGVSGVTAPTGVSIPSGAFLPRGMSGLSIDFKNGRIMMSGGNNGLNLQANVTVPQINTYITTLPEQKLLAETNFSVLPTLKTPNRQMPPYSVVLPALFFRLVHSENTTAAFSGPEWSDFNIRVTALLTENGQSVAITDLIRDLKNRNIPLLAGSVLNELNDLKDTNWDYNSQLNNPTDYFYVEDSYIDFKENDQFTQRNPNLYVGIGLIRARLFRVPRVEFP